jgi:DNA-binding NarL/FixJ family response regulator
VSRTCVQTERPAAGSRATSTRRSGVALIAGEGPREDIDAILEEQGLKFTVLDKVEDILERRSGLHQLVVLGIEGAIPWMVANIEPLREAIGEETPVVVVCAEILRWELRAVLAAGVAGVVLESEVSFALGPCLQAALAGQICVPRQHTAQIEPPALSTREKQILGLVVMGYMNSQIAEQLFVAESTVKSHLSSAFGKLGVRSRNEAVDLILNSERGLGMGILALGGEPVEPIPTTAQ